MHNSNIDIIGGNTATSVELKATTNRFGFEGKAYFFKGEAITQFNMPYTLINGV